MSHAQRPAAILFDLDGTLVDSAPDLLAALDHVRAGHGLPACDHQALREHVSRGAAGLLEAGLPALDSSVLEAARRQLLDYYADHYWQHSHLFEGVEALIDELRQRGIVLGVVTNKIARFAEPVLQASGLAEYFGCLIAGDQVSRPKPDPEPVLAACKQLGALSESTWFVGDDERDVIAGRAAGVTTVVAGWGYLPSGADPWQWGADALTDSPQALLARVDSGEPG